MTKKVFSKPKPIGNQLPGSQGKVSITFSGQAYNDLDCIRLELDGKKVNGKVSYTEAANYACKALAGYIRGQKKIAKMKG